MARYYRRRKSTSNVTEGLIVGVALLGIVMMIVSYLPVVQLSSVLIIVFALTVFLFGGSLLWLIIRQERKRLRALSFSHVDVMTGIEFEQYVGEILKTQGYHIIYTPVTGDYGTDIIAEREKEKISVQLKRYGKPVGPPAIQQAVASVIVYGCTKAMVVTNNTFTKEAKKLAEYNNCVLIDRNQLAEWIIAFQESK